MPGTSEGASPSNQRRMQGRTGGGGAAHGEGTGVEFMIGGEHKRSPDQIRAVCG